MATAAAPRAHVLERPPEMASTSRSPCAATKIVDPDCSTWSGSLGVASVVNFPVIVSKENTPPGSVSSVRTFCGDQERIARAGSEPEREHGKGKPDAMVVAGGHELRPRVVGGPHIAGHHGKTETIAGGRRCPIEVVDLTVSAGHHHATVRCDRQYGGAFGHGVGRELSTAGGIQLDHERS